MIFAGVLTELNVHSSLTQETKIIITAISVFSLSSVLTLAIGFLCGYYYKKEKEMNLQEERAGPQYQEIQLECRNNVVDVMKSVAYASVPLNH